MTAVSATEAYRMDGAACLERQKLKGVKSACQERKAETGGSGLYFLWKLRPSPAEMSARVRGLFSRAVVIIWESHSTAAGRSSRINRVVVFIESPLPH